MDENKSGATRRVRVAMAPRLEPLEGRRLMAANAAKVGIQEVTTGGAVALVITGTNKADVIHISDKGTSAAGALTVSLGDGRTYTSQAAIATVEVLGKGGNDQVTYDLNGNLTVPRSVLVDLGGGNDQFAAQLDGAIANPTGLNLQAYGGAGNDKLAVAQSGPILSGDSIPYLDGGAGNDTLAFAGTGAIEGGAALLPGLSGGAGNDTITSSYAGKITGQYVYNLTLDGGAGDDRITDTVRVGAGSTGSVGTDAGTPAAVLGGLGNDQIRFDVAVDPSVKLARVNAVAVGGAGKDAVQRTSNVLGDPSNEKNSPIS
jgi:hypothetical protein